MTQIPPPAAPPTNVVAPTLDEAGQAARDRLAQAFPEPVQPGAPADVAAEAAGTATPPAPVDFFADGAVDALIPDDVPYRDAKKLREQMQAAKDQFKPYRDAFGSLDDEQRQALLQVAPTLGADLATFGQVASALHPDDRAYFARAMELMATDPAQAAQMLSAGAEVLRGQYAPPGAAQAPQAPLPPGTQPMPEWAQPDAQVEDPAQQVMTRADFEAWDAQRQYQAAVTDNERQILARARELGYDPDSNDPVEDARFRTLLGLAARPEVGMDLDKAHAYVEGMEQAAIDRFVQAKAANADRPGVPAIGTTPADTRVLETLADGREAMLARLDGTLGPDPRRRSAED